MKSIKILIALSVTFLFCSNIYSQNSLNPDSLTVGVSYKFVMYDDTEVIGKITGIDSVHITVMADKGAYRLKKEDIFFVSRELVSDKFKAILSLGGGISFLNSYSDAPYHDGESYKGKIALQLSALFPLGESKGIRADIGYSRWVRDAFEETNNWGNYNYTYYSARSINYYYIKADFVLGSFLPSNKFWIYGTGGIGIHFLNEGRYHYENTYTAYDSTLHTYSYDNPGRTYTSALLSIGGAFGYRFSKNLGVYADVQLNTIAHEGFFLFFWGGGGAYIPIRAGITYIIY